MPWCLMWRNIPGFGNKGHTYQEPKPEKCPPHSTWGMQNEWARRQMLGRSHWSRGLHVELWKCGRFAADGISAWICCWMMLDACVHRWRWCSWWRNQLALKVQRACQTRLPRTEELYRETSERSFWAGNSTAENRRKVQVAKELFAAKYGPDPPVLGLVRGRMHARKVPIVIWYSDVFDVIGRSIFTGCKMLQVQTCTVTKVSTKNDKNKFHVSQPDSTIYMIDR